MHDAPEPGSRQDHGPASPPVPERVISLRAERESAPDYIAPLAVMAILVSLAGTTCLPLATVVGILSGRQQNTQSAAADSRDPLLPASQPTTAASVELDIPVVTLGAVLVFFGIAVLGMIGGFATILRREWGRKLLLAYAVLVLIYLAGAVSLRLRFGIEGLTQTAPTASALSLNFTCVFGVILLVAILMIAILRYLTQPHIVARFR